MAEDRFEGWAILELMGHRRLAGWVTETELAGQGVLRLDVPREGAADDDGWLATQFYAPSALYCLTPTSEETARAVAARSAPEPVHRWELPAAPAVPVPAAADEIPDDDPWPDDREEDLVGP
jgi:hypothetical protein